MWTKIEERLKRRALLSLPVKVIDGREPILVVREGEQHDLVGTAQAFAQAFRVPAAFVSNLAEAIFQRLGQQVAEVYVAVGASLSTLLVFAALNTKPQIRDRPVNMGEATIPLRIFQQGARPPTNAEIKETVKAFCAFYTLPQNAEKQLLKAVQARLYPGAEVA